MIRSCVEIDCDFVTKDFDCEIHENVRPQKFEAISLSIVLGSIVLGYPVSIGLNIPYSLNISRTNIFENFLLPRKYYSWNSLYINEIPRLLTEPWNHKNNKKALNFYSSKFLGCKEKECYSERIPYMVVLVMPTTIALMCCHDYPYFCPAQWFLLLPTEGVSSVAGERVWVQQAARTASHSATGNVIDAQSMVLMYWCTGSVESDPSTASTWSVEQIPRPPIIRCPLGECDHVIC